MTFETQAACDQATNQTGATTESAPSFPHEATYSAEDNKIRIYFSYFLDKEEYQRVKDLSFQNAPKQGCHFAVWSPEREDFALEMAGEITPEGTTLAERAAAKAARLDDLSEKNARKANSFHSAANAISQRFSYGQPILIGHHSERSARRDKARMESAMTQANRCAGMVEYWNYKATGVERHANYKNRDDVRERRIKTLLAELRGYQRDLNDSYAAIKFWEKIEKLKDQDAEKFTKAVGYYSGLGNLSPFSTYSKVQDGKMTPEEAVEVSLEHHYKIVESQTKSRWITHTLNRLAFERAELGEVERFDGDLTPVILQAFLREHGADSPKATPSDIGFKAVSGVYFPVHICADLVTELDLSADAWRDLMQASGYEVPAKKPRRASTSEKVALPLINPTREDAERLQALWNARMAKAVEGKQHVTAKTATIREMTQEQYSANSKGTYSAFETIELMANGDEVSTKWECGVRVKTGESVCRIRVSNANFDTYKPKTIIFINDKSSKSLPITWEE